MEGHTELEGELSERLEGTLSLKPQNRWWEDLDCHVHNIASFDNWDHRECCVGNADEWKSAIWDYLPDSQEIPLVRGKINTRERQLCFIRACVVAEPNMALLVNVLRRLYIRYGLGRRNHRAYGLIPGE
mmetsp:Transcript_19905/g.79491  ORF Transcript_19905/g.79491 Transcript_19905/m.79491 type:complete len:129 (+) Transcript_19905:174-560(+)